jgi:hypothetical protein
MSEITSGKSASSNPFEPLAFERRDVLMNMTTECNKFGCHIHQDIPHASKIRESL